VLPREQKPASAFEIHGDDPLEQLRQVVTAMACPRPNSWSSQP